MYAYVGRSLNFMEIRMSFDPEEARMEEAREAYEAEIGETYLREFGHELLYPEHYEEAVEEFTAERLRSFYVAHPDLARPAHESLIYADSLMPSYPRAALVFAVTATELVVKTVLLKPIVFGLVHTEGLASYITELTTAHTGMDRFQKLLTEILAQFGGVDFKTFKRTNSTKALYEEIGEVQKARNAVIHRGEAVDNANADLAIAVATTLLSEMFPLVLAKLDLHLHQPMTVCGQSHLRTSQPLENLEK
jgi:hypothetical protein